MKYQWKISKDVLFWQNTFGDYYFTRLVLFRKGKPMFETDIRKIDFWGKNIVKSHHVNLDMDLDCVILLSSKDSKLSELLYNKIIDSVIDRIHPKNVYKDFSNSLENINSFLSTWRHEDDKIKGLHGIIGIYSKKTFLFSSIGSASAYLYNTHTDVIEITDKDESPSEFNFISSGEVTDGESLVLSTMRLLDILSKDDIRDGLLGNNMKRSSENIETILLQEHSGKNIWLLSVRKHIPWEHPSKMNFEKISYYIFRTLDNKLTKNALWYLYHLQDRVSQQSQKVKQYLLAWAIFISIFLLYWVISWFFQVATMTQSSEQAKKSLLEAQNLVVQAGENMNNPDMFLLNVTQAQTILTQLQSQALFLEDISLMKDNIALLQKQFNGIESFEAKTENTLYLFPSSASIVKILSVADKVYIVEKNSITGPIISWEEAQSYEFKEGLDAGDSFIDATEYEGNIVLMTQLGKVVNFWKNNFFNYVDVNNQTMWEKSPIIAGYSNNIYLLSDSQTQILRHRRQGNSYTAGDSYLTDADAANIWKILSLAIDGGIYILKADGNIVKLYREPKYRLENIVLNKLPKNYNFTNIVWSTSPYLQAAADLKYVYMFFENKILVFKPNTTRVQDTKSLQYLGQIEGKNMTIESFYVENDGEIFLAGKSWVYKAKFEVIEDKVVLR
jgi:hypothetical protein